MDAKQPKIQAIMNVEKRETIAGMWVTPRIPQIGFINYSPNAKQTARVNGSISFRGKTAAKSAFPGRNRIGGKVAGRSGAANKILGKTFGIGIRLKAAEFDSYTVNGKNFDDTVH